MRRKFAVLAALGVFLALAVAPASSMAWMTPNFKWEIVGDSNGPKLTTSLGSCSFAKFTGQDPSNGETSSWVKMPAPTLGSCTSGASLTLGVGGWLFEGSGFQMEMLPEAPMTLRYASLPGCKLTGPMFLAGIWSNGIQGTVSNSGFTPSVGGSMTWQNDGGTCALSGQKEAVNFEASKSKTIGNLTQSVPASYVVNDLTAPGYPVILK